MEIRRYGLIVLAPLQITLGSGKTEDFMAMEHFIIFPTVKIDLISILVILSMEDIMD
jgi:hypothetical protein